MLTTTQALSVDNTLTRKHVLTEYQALNRRRSEQTVEPPNPDMFEHVGIRDELVKENKKKEPLPGSKLLKAEKFLYYRNICDEPKQRKSVPLDAVAQAKRKRLRGLDHLYASRPRSGKLDCSSEFGTGATVRNVKQAIIEDPVRRMTLFTSMIGGPEVGQLELRLTRGIRLQPCRVECGRVPAGSTRFYCVRLVNWGPENAYFRVRQPPESSRLRVLYTPGPIPAGLSRDLRIKLTVPRTAECLSSTDSQAQLVQWRDDQAKVAESAFHDEPVVHTFTEYIQLTTDTHIIHIPVSGEIEYKE
ncbi:unnamed protein product [Dicrocoelium dendriticum]|nr:unnamed protein product [Dicrocoelium dendriticum]